MLDHYRCVLDQRTMCFGKTIIVFWEESYCFWEELTGRIIFWEELTVLGKKRGELKLKWGELPGLKQ
jgi:hypothetical protein